ncbi:MAG: hypothetical protein ACPLRY_07280 [Candidatus Bathyarchaeales archaeon]
MLIQNSRRGLNITVFHEDDDGYYSDARESLPYHNAKQANLALQTVGSVAIRKQIPWEENLGIKACAQNLKSLHKRHIHHFAILFLLVQK